MWELERLIKFRANSRSLLYYVFFEFFLVYSLKLVLAQLIMRGLWYTMIIVSILFALNDHQREGKFQQTVNVMLLINNQDQFSSVPCLLAPKAQNFKAIVSDGFNMHFLFTVWSCQQIFHKVWTTNFPCMSVEACLISQNRNPLYV